MYRMLKYFPHRKARPNGSLLGRHGSSYKTIFHTAANTRLQAGQGMLGVNAASSSINLLWPRNEAAQGHLVHVLLTKPLLLLLPPPLHSHRHMAMHGTRRRATTPMVVACLLACTGKIPTDRPTDQVLGRVCVRRARMGGGWILARHANRPTTTTPPPPLAVRAIRALSSLAVHAVCVCAATTTASSSSTFPPHCRRSRHRLVCVYVRASTQKTSSCSRLVEAEILAMPTMVPHSAAQ